MAKKGVKQSEEHKAKIRAARKKNDELLNRTYSAWNKGKVGVQESTRKGKKFEEIFGKEKSDVIKDKIRKSVIESLPSSEILKERNKNVGKRVKEARLGKTFEEIYGVEKSNEIKLKQSKSQTGKVHVITENRLKGRIKSIITRKENNSQGGGKSKFYETPIGKVQGKYELHYVNYLIREKIELPLKPKGIKTPTGYYFPDFEFIDKFIEIKSQFTYDVFIGKEKSLDGDYNTKQKNKAEWVAQNVKPVEIIIMNYKGEIVNQFVL